jgi:hypothetical protein
MKEYRCYSDSGHGWMAVKRKELIELGILNQITQFSYQSLSGKTVYLEEDCDVTLFVNKYIEKNGQHPQLKRSSYKDVSPIRRLPSFKA